MNLSEARKGEIALIIFKEDVKNKQMTLNRNEFRRKFGNAMEVLAEKGISKEEALSLYEETVREGVEEMFS